MKYTFMKQHIDEFSVNGMCRALSASHSGFYAWLKNLEQVSAQQKRRAVIDQKVKLIFNQKKQRYGAPRIWNELYRSGISVSPKTVANSMGRQELCAKAAKKFKATTMSNHRLPVAKNLLEQDFTATKPNQKWVSDITYLSTDQGWVYLSVIIDLYSRLIVGWAMSERIDKQLVCDALQMALWRRKMPKNVILHSDRGSQYCSNDYQEMIKKYGLLCSMSGKGNCYDNACAESFFHSLKVEAIHGERFKTREIMRQTVFEYIEVDYNRTRQHSANGYLSPMVFEAK